MDLHAPAPDLAPRDCAEKRRNPSLMPMLVGLHELMFWLELWHSEPEAGSQNPAQEFKGFLEAELITHKLTVDDLEAWRPEKKKAKRKGKARA